MGLFRKPATEPPPSCTHFWLNFFGFGCFILAVVIMRLYFPTLSLMWKSVVAILAVVLPIVLVEVFVYKVHRNPTAKIGAWNPLDRARIGIKLLGLFGTLGVMGFCYWLFPEYDGEFYRLYMSFLWVLIPIILFFSWYYFMEVDLRMENPRDGYWHMGQFMLGNWEGIDWKLLAEHYRGWIVKGFFLPLMFTYMANDINFLVNYDFSKMTNFLGFYDYAYVFIFTMDVAFACVGYIITFRFLDTHIRSVEPTMLGWLVAIMCYSPFWTAVFYGSYFTYNDGFYWGHMTEQHPILHIVWGSMILVTITIYSLATVCLGLRFSNLTYRGLVANGPYRYTKHPAYISKNLSWWMVSVPFIVHVDVATSVKYCLMLLGVNFVYYMRAKTEENHLSHYPEYVEYANWMNENGIFRFVGEWFPIFKYDAEKARQGHPKILEPK